MNVWTERVESSQILVRLRELGPAIDKAVAREDNDSTDVQTLERMRLVLTVIGKRLDGADAQLFVSGSLEQLAGEIANAIAFVTSFGDTGTPDALTSANQAMDRALSIFGTFVMPTTPDDVAGLREAATSYRATMERELELWADIAARTRGQAAEVEKAAAAIDKRITEEAERLSTAVSTIESENQATGARLAEAFDVATKKLEADTAASLTGLQAAFDTAEKARADAHQVEVDGQVATFDALLEKHEGILKATDATWDQKLADLAKKYESDEARLRTSYEEKASATLTTIEGHLKRVQELVGAIGDHGVTAGFKREADDARKEVVFWHRVTFWAMVLLILVGLGTAFHVFDYRLTWISLASRLYLSIAIGVLAAYAASQASRYQYRERRSRKLELELRALGPFLEPVEPARREEFRLKIAEVFFGKDDGGNDRPGPATPLHLSKESFDKAMDLAKAAMDKFPGRGGA
jgi:hypothetical protein